MANSNIKWFFGLVIVVILFSCKSTNQNQNKEFIVVKSSDTFKINKEDADVFIPHIQVLYTGQDHIVKENIANNYKRDLIVRENLINSYKRDLNKILNKKELFMISDFLKDIQTGNNITDSLENIDIKVIPNRLKTILSQSNSKKKYSVVSCFKGYDSTHFSTLNVFVIDNQTFEKVYYQLNNKKIHFHYSDKTYIMLKDSFLSIFN